MFDVKQNPMTVTHLPASQVKLQCKVELLKTVDEFDAMEQEWNELVSNADVSIYQTFEWLRTCWTYFGKGHELHILVFRSDVRLIGIAPMFLNRIKLGGAKLATRLQFIGCPISDYLDLIILPEYTQVVIDAFARYLQSSSNLWNVFDLEDVSERSITFHLLPLMMKKYGIRVHLYQGNVCPERQLPSTWEQFVQSVGPNLRNNLKRKSKRLNENFRVEVEAIQNPADDITAGIEAFSKLHGERWTSLGYPSAFDDAHHRAFHTEFAKKFAARDWLRLFFLKVDNQRVAVIFNFHYKKRIYMYQSNASGPEEIMKCSPGMLIKGIAIERGIAEGMDVFDFLRGDEPYKYEEWKAVNSRNWLIRSSAPAASAKLRFKMFLAYEFAKKSKERLQREYYEFKRFKITKEPSSWMVVKYIKSKLIALVGLGINYIARHLSKKSD
jgi:CelD/BcsL family acetyltransferase involved in cellulose biosynthesis